MKYTIKDVADKAGVSIATVSRVINGSPVVSEKSKQKVLDIIEELRFKPSQTARNLVMQKSNSIGVIVPEIINQFSGGILNGIEKMCSSLGFDVMIYSTKGNHEKEMRYLELFQERNVAGIIFMAWKLMSETIQVINDLSIPVVMVGRYASGLNVPTVSIDNFQAAYEMTNYLIEKGHRRIAFFRNSVDLDSCGVKQYSGFERALAEAGIFIDRELVKYGEFSEERSYNIMKEIIDAGNCPTAVFATSDVMAISIMNALKDNGLDVPGDVSVVGFNDVQLSSIYRPKLTVIHQPLLSMGAEAVKMIVNEDDNLETNVADEHIADGRIVILPHKLIERDSCRAILPFGPEEGK